MILRPRPKAVAEWSLLDLINKYKLSSSLHQWNYTNILTKINQDTRQVAKKSKIIQRNLCILSAQSSVLRYITQCSDSSRLFIPSRLISAIVARSVADDLQGLCKNIWNSQPQGPDWVRSIRWRINQKMINTQFIEIRIRYKIYWTILNLLTSFDFWRTSH